jgi:Zn ribbon nucleic-acid-binding protein
MSILKTLFKKQPPLVETKVTPVAGNECPHCHQGGLFFYKEDNIYICEECLNVFDKDKNLIQK